MESGIVFNIQRFSLDDGQGIRTCIFLKGCPLRCVWCHNAESQTTAPEIACSKKRCIACGGCVRVCPVSCHRVAPDHTHIFDRARCVLCGKCADACPTGALERVGRLMTAADVISVAERDRVFYGSGSGITVTGGEPMAQSAFSAGLARLAREKSLSVNIETGGYASEDAFKQLLPYVDCFLYDCKAASEDHRDLTGVEDDLILKNLDLLCSEGANVILRCPVVPGANLNERFIRKICSLAVKYPMMKAIRLMPYHSTGIGKNDLLGKPSQKRFDRPDDEMMENIRKQIRIAARMPVF